MLKDKFTEMIEKYVTSFYLKKMCLELLEETDFFTETGAHRYHHAYTGGLAEHTYEVLQYAEGLGQAHKANMEVLIVAGLFHDTGKVADHSSKDHESQIGHLCRSLMIFHDRAMKHEHDVELVMNIEHCIIAHHGRHDWGSPMLPKTVEASILHFADMVSSQHGHGKYRSQHDNETRSA